MVVPKSQCDPMNRAEYEVMYRIEDSYWWYLGIREIARSVLGGHLRPDLSRRVLDCGCGTGGNLGMLSNFGTVFGAELSREAARFLKSREFRRFSTASITALPYRGGSFDLVTVFYVTECLDDDSPAFREYHRALKPGGLLFMAEVAFESLRGEHDLAVGIKHRYTRKELTGRLKDAGFEIVRCSYINTILFPPIFALRRLRRLFAPVSSREEAKSDFGLAPGPLHGFFKWTLFAEARLLKFMNLPFGVSVMALAKKP